MSSDDESYIVSNYIRIFYRMIANNITTLPIFQFLNSRDRGRTLRFRIILYTANKRSDYNIYTFYIIDELITMKNRK